MAKREKWPRLSATLPHVAPWKCGQCGGHYLEHDCDLELWREHDDNDRGEHVYFWLCTRCAAKIIDPHPRLYGRVHEYTPAPGAMRICEDCPHRVRCTCPLTKYNGGPGIMVNACQPTIIHIDRTVKGRHVGEWHRNYQVPPSGCTGKTPGLTVIDGSSESSGQLALSASPPPPQTSSPSATSSAAGQSAAAHPGEPPATPAPPATPG